MKLPTVLAAAVFLFQLTPPAHAHKDHEPGFDKPYTVEFYYNIKWGYEEEWLELYKKNHWPVLMAEIEAGHLVDVKLDRSRERDGFSDRWNYRVTITYKNILLPHGMGERNKEPILKRLYPDRERFEEEERQRFKILNNLKSVEVVPVDTSDWPLTGQN